MTNRRTPPPPTTSGAASHPRRTGSAPRPTIGAAAWLRPTLLTLALAALLTLTILARALPGASTAARQHIGQRAPTFALVATRDGQRLPGLTTLSALLTAANGQPTLLYFFSSLCPHCGDETRALASLTATASAAHPPHIIYIDSPAETPTILSAYLSRLGVTSAALLDPAAQVAQRYAIHYYPTAIQLDPSGVIRAAWVGETPASVLRSALSAAPISSTPSNPPNPSTHALTNPPIPWPPIANQHPQRRPTHV